jgi:DNA-binding PadR family transcriptional regulator
MSLSPSARVLLGMLNIQPASGYEIKQLADRTTRHFWRISYGQIYPELRRLEADGLITTIEDHSDGRGRKVHTITTAGKRALREWLIEDADMGFELRDEAILKLFFADLLTDEETLELVRTTRERHERLRLELEGIHELAESAGTPGRPNFRLMTLRNGIALHDELITLCDRMEAEIAEGAR